jgi:hypothetical protein
MIYLYKGNSTTSIFLASLGTTTNIGKFNYTVNTSLVAGSYFF